MQQKHAMPLKISQKATEIYVTGLFVSIEHNPLKAVFVSYEPKDHYQ
jgi:hypothetical protein